MANKITATNFRPQDGFVAPLSRYLNSTIIYYGNNNLLTFTTYVKQIAPDDSADKFAVVPAGMEYRPDLVSQQAYGVPDFWWKIMEVNAISDIMNFKSGINIRLPNNIYY
jgi:hypothetical protein